MLINCLLHIVTRALALKGQQARLQQLRRTLARIVQPA
jgi:hypothetical protein